MSFINPPPNSNQILQNNHPIIERKNDYLLNRKLFSIHSEDIDYSKWPNSSEFQIQCPQSYKNVQSIRLVEINFPTNYYNISNKLQNNKFRIIAISQDCSNGHPSYIDDILEEIIVNGDDFDIDTFDCSLSNPCYQKMTITIPDGYYTNKYLAKTIAFHLNQLTQSAASKCGDLSWNPQFYWNAIYDEVRQKILIGNNGNLFFVLDNSYIHNYDISCNITSQEKYFNRHNKFSLLSCMGYNEKKQYSSQLSTTNLYKEYEYLTTLTPSDFSSNIWIESIDGSNVYSIESPSTVNLTGETVMYMELDYFNSYDELIPWPDTSGNTQCYPQCARSANSVKNNHKNTNPTFPGRKGPPYPSGYPPGPTEPKYIAHRGVGINSAFAKIPINNNVSAQFFTSINDGLFNMTQYSPPIERISKLKFKFRYHDGTLVDFNNKNFNFTLEINELINDFKTDLNIRQAQFVQLS